MLEDKIKRLKEGKCKVVTPPEKAFKNITPPTYLIETVGNSKFLIHRELQDNEQKDYIDHEIAYYNGRKFLIGITTTSTEESAKQVINGYFEAIKKLDEGFLNRKE